ncbi:MAG: leucine-rich repeat protein [Evtepia sp.]
MPTGLKRSPSGLCDGCEQLSSVLADSVKTIATNAFRNTKALKAIDLKKVQAIGGYAFQGSGLTDLVLPKAWKRLKAAHLRHVLP